MKVNFDKTFKDCFGNEVVNDKTGKATNIAESLCMVIFNLNSMGAYRCHPTRSTRCIKSVRK